MSKFIKIIGCMMLFSSIPNLAHAKHKSSGVSHHIQKRSNQKDKVKKSKLVGLASWYGRGFSGRKTASGSRFNPNELTAAHKTLPLGTKVIVTNLNNGKETELKITDRGPYVGKRILDVSKGAALKLGMLKTGVARIKIKVIGKELPVEYAQAK